jgi:hypothetical protein
VRRFEPVAALGGALLLSALFPPWFSAIDLPGGFLLAIRGQSGPRSAAPFGDLELRHGAWLALAGALIAQARSRMALRDESTPGAVAPDVPRRPAPPATSP